MIIKELYLNDEKVSNVSIHIYQQKTSSIFFVTIIIRLNVTFTVSQLTRFNTNPGNIHHKTADQTIQYLYNIKEKALRYEDENNEAHSFICVSNISFANNTLNHKSFQN